MSKIKRWLIFVAGLVVALILGVLVAGMLLPEEHHASRTLVTRQSPQAIWDAINDQQMSLNGVPTSKASHFLANVKGSKCGGRITRTGTKSR